VYRVFHEIVIITAVAAVSGAGGCYLLTYLLSGM